jgi:sterol desaturase/sphingolipid hydroxylase (fatty acid hydroxylase superfamily)
VFSLFFFSLEMLKPWRKEQARFRKDFWLDFFYVFFNFFIFGLIFWTATQNVLVEMFNNFLGYFGVENIVMLQLDNLPVWAYYIILFVVADLLSWWVHRMLHWVPFMWRWHKVHHSVEQMGFAAHVRYHWMENVVYWVCRYIPLTMLGADLVDIFGIHVVNLAWGHFNHTNTTVDTRITGGIVGAGLLALVARLNLGETMWVLAALPVGAIAGAFILGPFMRKIFNSPEMHIWHHSWELPEDKPYGINFGITLAIWDYIFGTAHVPHSGRDIALGFDGLARFPKTFLGQLVYGFGPDKKNSEGSESVSQ